VAAFEWTCQRCGETFDSRETSALQHSCIVAKESAQFHKAFKTYLSEPAGQFAMYYAQRLIRGNSDGSNNTLVI
jgi:transposase-like protein